jgi:hypothetical protein
MAESDSNNTQDSNAIGVVVQCPCSASECPRCHYTVITDENVYCCPSCGEETCPDCAGRCGCEIDEPNGSDQEREHKTL